jgi:hypothetical protein
MHAVHTRVMRATHLALSGWLAEERLGSDWTKTSTRASTNTQTYGLTISNTRTIARTTGMTQI